MKKLKNNKPYRYPAHRHIFTHCNGQNNPLHPTNILDPKIGRIFRINFPHMYILDSNEGTISYAPTATLSLLHLRSLTIDTQAISFLSKQFCTSSNPLTKYAILGDWFLNLHATEYYTITRFYRKHHIIFSDCRVSGIGGPLSSALQRLQKIPNLDTSFISGKH